MIDAPACANAVHGIIVVITASNAILNQPRMSPPWPDQATTAGRAATLPRRDRYTAAAYPAPIGTDCPIQLWRSMIRNWYRIRRHGLPPPARVHRCGRGI